MLLQGQKLGLEWGPQAQAYFYQELNYIEFLEEKLELHTWHDEHNKKNCSCDGGLKRWHEMKALFSVLIIIKIMSKFLYD